MPESSQRTPKEKRPSDVSPQALSVARMLDRVCRAPGTYTITLTISPHARQPWHLQLSRVELLRDTTAPGRR